MSVLLQLYNECIVQSRVQASELWGVGVHMHQVVVSQLALKLFAPFAEDSNKLLIDFGCKRKGYSCIIDVFIFDCLH